MAVAFTLKHDGADGFCEVAEQVGVVRLRGMDEMLLLVGLVHSSHGPEVCNEWTSLTVRI